MTARWRTLLRMRALLRLLLDGHVPLGALIRCIEQVKGIDDAQLPNEQRVHVATPTGSLASDLVLELLGDDAEMIDRDRDTWHGQREKWRDLIEHIRERRAAVLADESLLCASPIATELLDLIAWIGTVQPDPRPPGEPRDLLRIGDELRRRRVARGRAADVAAGDRARDAEDEHKAVALELDELLAFVLPLQGAPLPDVARFESFIASRELFDLMQAYRHEPVENLQGVVDRFEAVKAALIEAARR